MSLLVCQRIAKSANIQGMSSARHAGREAVMEKDKTKGRTQC